MTLSGKTIMLVDDEPDILAVFKMGLENSNARAETFSRPSVALGAFAGRPDAYDLVIVDVRMSEMNGIEFAKKVCAIRVGQPILFVSAFDYDQTQLGSADGHRQAREFLKKPVSLPALLDAVEKLICNSSIDA